MHSFDRRHFLTTTLALPMVAPLARGASAAPVRFGIISDLHHGMRDDVHQRLERFITTMQESGVDFIIQLGDFCHSDGTEASQKFLDAWNTFQGPRYHVLGNHDMDKNTKTAACDFWQINSPYYTFDTPLFTGMVLDTNFFFRDNKYVEYDTANWYGSGAEGYGCLPPEQTEWMIEQASRSTKPVFLFSHYGFDHAWGAWNRGYIRRALQDHNRRAERNRVATAFCGHYHLDGVNTIEQIHYIRINSASYHWLGSWEGEKWIWYTDPLFAIVEVHPEGAMEITGRSSTFEGTNPFEQGFSREPDRNITAAIENRSLYL